MEDVFALILSADIAYDKARYCFCAGVNDIAPQIYCIVFTQEMEKYFG